MRRPQNLLPMSVALLALVVAGTGTAVAATSTTTISDPTNSSYVAHVNSSGQLQVSGPVSVSAPGVPFLTTAFIENFNEDSSGFQLALGPTLATLGLTQITLVDPASNAEPWSEYLFQVPATSSTACGTVPSASLHRVGTLEAAPGTDDESNLTPPYVVKPLTGNQYYCILAAAEPDTGSGSNTDDVITTIRGYVLSGTAPASPDASKAHGAAAG
jgi:hypothetical protein